MSLSYLINVYEIEIVNVIFDLELLDYLNFQVGYPLYPEHLDFYHNQFA